MLVVGPSGNGGISQYITGQVERLGCSVETHDTGSPPSGNGPVWVLRSILLGLAAMCRFSLRTRPDVVHVHSSYQYSFYRASFYTLFSRYVWGVPVVLHIHGSSFDEFVLEASPPVAALQHLVFDASDQIIVLSEYWLDVVATRIDESKIRVVPNAVEPASYPAEFGIEPPRIVFVSNLIERKGVRELVAAVDSLAETCETPFEVSIAGAGPLAGEVEALSERHDSVSYLGFVSEEQKRSLLGSSSVFVLPTYAEGLPIALLEGMAGGNAVVTTAVGSIPEVIDEERGILVPPGDADALEAALEDLVTSPDLCEKMATRNRRAIETEYSWDEVIDELVTVYRSVV
ncbi:glycosyltransferase family 4 protein [Halosimplex amylolyticum]|uniref:glycosyltransferase family 4 protein n=1 Tax=Halosimplex amylolyticum TaxID=3396616 RepID=UPI003F56C667